MTPLRRLIGYFLPYRRILVLGVACVFMTNLVRMGAPVVLRHAVDELATSISHYKLLGYGGLLILIALGQGVFLYSATPADKHLPEIESDLRNDSTRTSEASVESIRPTACDLMARRPTTWRQCE